MIGLAADLKADDAIYYMRYGAGRRLLMMWRAYRTITLTVPPERDKPLSDEEQTTLSRDINVIYMHLRGVLDNFAWCYLYEKEPSLIEHLRTVDVYLFSREIRKRTTLPDFWREVDGHAAWATEAKARRDPVAHRIPLYIPFTVVAPDEVEQYHNLTRAFYEAANKLDFDATDMITEQMHLLGCFLPFFVHHPEEGYVPIYPTLPGDMAHLIRLGQTVRRHIT
jgi:hypothetical protein